MCDWNEDDSLDLITGERDGHLTFFRRTGTGELTNGGRIQSNGTDIVTSSNSWPFVVDWDEDGKKDLLVGQEGLYLSCNVFVYLNQGTNAAPVFGDSTPVLRNGSPFPDWRCIPLALDLDNDDNKDLVLGEWYSSVRLYHNQGTNAAPVFTTFVDLVPPDPDSFLNGNPPRVNFTDWDGDLDLDMLTCDYYGSVFLRENITPAGVTGAPPALPAPAGCPTLVRGGPVAVPGCTDVELLDPCGRRVANDAQLAPGNYFVRARSAGRVTVTRVTVTR